MDNTIEILEYSYWEHFKFAKDIALVLPVNHPKRKAIEKELNDISEKIIKLKTKK